MLVSSWHNILLSPCFYTPVKLFCVLSRCRMRAKENFPDTSHHLPRDLEGDTWMSISVPALVVQHRFSLLFFSLELFSPSCFSFLPNTFGYLLPNVFLIHAYKMPTMKVELSVASVLYSTCWRGCLKPSARHSQT